MALASQSASSLVVIWQPLPDRPCLLAKGGGLIIRKVLQRSVQSVQSVQRFHKCLSTKEKRPGRSDARSVQEAPNEASKRPKRPTKRPILSPYGFSVYAISGRSGRSGRFIALLFWFDVGQPDDPLSVGRLGPLKVDHDADLPE